LVIIDSTVWIDYLGGVDNSHTRWLQHNVQRKRLGMTDLNLCEILQGARSHAAFADLRLELSRFKIFNSGGEALAIAAAANYRTLRSRGYTVRGTIDCLIATFCIQHNHSLLHNDRDFDPFEQHLELRVVHPLFEAPSGVHLQ
jgi:predicted nucleic acid-binding protein